VGNIEMKIKIFLLSLVVLAALVWIAYNNYFKYRNAVHIAFVGPLSGEGAAAGKLMTQAIQLYFDYINQRGGINGKQIILQEFDDQNDPQQARQQALNIVKSEEQFMAVIGHWYSSASISGGKVYQTHQIPAITPGSSNIKVTQGNPWYFRNIYNDKATSRFLAHYIKKVFKQDQVTIIHETADYGSYIAETFAQEAKSIDITIKNNWQYRNQDKNLDAVFQQFIEQLQLDKDKAGIILLAMQASEGVKFVKLIKEAGIKIPLIGASSFSEETFRNGFDTEPIERENPGYYTNDIYVATPLLFDTANEKAQLFLDAYKEQYNEEPDWSAAYAYDTAMVLVEAMKQANLKGVPNSLAADRKKLRDTLASFTNIHDAVKGVTGFNYFDNYRDAQKLVSLGVYKQKNLVSALTQFHVLRNPDEIVDIQQALRDEQILTMDNRYMYKTHVVYVGIKVHEISHIDMKQLVYHLDFKLWFRFLQSDLKPTDIQFTNAVDPQKLNAQLAKSLEDCKVTLDKIVYCVYRIKGDFRADFLTNYYSYKKHVVGISFRHRTLTRNNLIYVTDMLGMGLNQEQSLAQYLTKTHVLGPAEGWLIDRVWFFPDVAKEFSAGDPQHLNAAEGIVEYSRFNAAIQLKQDQLTLRGSIPYKYAHDIMILSGTLFLFFAVAASSKKKLSKYLWFFQVVFAFLWLLSGEIIFADWLAQKTNPYQMKHIIRTFDILWWLIPAFLVNEALERFIWRPIQETVGAIPNIIRHFFALFIYLLAIVGITVFVYEQQFTSLLATSSVLAMIVGLAIQINISNVFSGIVINMDRPFRMGDWIKIGEFEEGEVIDINWRATRLKGRNGCMTSIPNAQAAEAAITNFYYPQKIYWLWPTVYVHPKHPPFRVKKILQDALLSADKILQDPKPVVIFTGINEWAATYWIVFGADDYGDKYFILESVWTRVWFHLNRANIAPAVMRQEIYIFKGENYSDPAPSSKTPPFEPPKATWRSAPFTSPHSLVKQG
jgi:branched-chain amino acid transport system substrate-binding protein